MAKGFNFNPGPAIGKIVSEQRRRMSKAAHTLSADVKRSFKKGKKIGKGRWDPSEPGDPPGIQLGNLKRSILAEVIEDGGDFVGMVGPMTIVGGVSMKYARWLEFGTSKMPGGRPFLRPALERKKNELYAILAGK